MKVVCISGKAQHGKDTTAGILKNVLESYGKSVLITHYADLLKYICREYFNWDGKKDEAGRKLLQYVGTDIVREQRPDFWVEFISSILQLFPDQWDYVLIPDCRFPNEIDAMKEAGFDVFSLRVVRSNFESPLTKKQQQHLSETALDDYHFDAVLLNVASLSHLEDTICGAVSIWFGGLND